MTAQKFVKRPDVFEAMQFTGENATEIVTWAQGGWSGDPLRPMRGEERFWLKQSPAKGEPYLVPGDKGEFSWVLVVPPLPNCPTQQEARKGDWIVKEEFSPAEEWAAATMKFTVMKSEAFAKAYAPAEPPMMCELTEEDREAIARSGPGEVVFINGEADQLGAHQQRPVRAGALRKELGLDLVHGSDLEQFGLENVYQIDGTPIDAKGDGRYLVGTGQLVDGRRILVEYQTGRDDLKGASIRIHFPDGDAIGSTSFYDRGLAGLTTKAIFNNCLQINAGAHLGAWS